MSSFFVSHTQDDLKAALEPHFQRLGWQDIITYLELGPDFHGYNLSVVMNLKITDKDLKSGINYQVVENIVKPFADKLYDSPLVYSLKKKHEQEVQDLKDAIKLLEQTNHNLTALLANELEYLEGDGVE